MTDDLRHTLQVRLSDLARLDLHRSLRISESPADPVVVREGRRLIHLTSNNYLGLANHPSVRRAAQAAIERWGVGAGASRLVSGTFDAHRELEQALAEFLGTESALVFSSGYLVNLGVVTALTGPGDVLYSDALNHASLVDACRLSRADVRVFRHADPSHLAELLRGDAAGRDAQSRRLIVTDTVFSMGGDLASLREIADLAERHGAWVMADEAHATGVLGPTGAGLAEELGLGGRIGIRMGTLGKALGSFGAFVAGSRELVEWLVNRARSFIYTTALPPAMAAAALAALQIVKAEPDRRRLLHDNAAFLRRGLADLGFNLCPTRTQIVPVLLGAPAAAVRFAAALERRGVWAHPMRPPTVPEGTSRLRLTPMATHTREHLTQALAAFAAAGRELELIP